MARGVLGVLLALLLLTPGAAAASPFANWAAVVVAGDFHAAGGSESEAFDNARRDVTAALVRRGFNTANIQGFSVRPQLYPDAGLLPSNRNSLRDGLANVARRATGGCLVYFTSHGAPVGLQLGTEFLPPLMLSQMVKDACGTRPTVLVISACFSGVFLQALSAPNRAVLTAARPDRTSFGCGVSDKYPYFDDCFLQVIGVARDFGALAPAVQSCVAQREQREGMTPPSEPQFWVDPSLRPMLPLYAFS